REAPQVSVNSRACTRATGIGNELGICRLLSFFTRIGFSCTAGDFFGVLLQAASSTVTKAIHIKARYWRTLFILKYWQCSCRADRYFALSRLCHRLTLVINFFMAVGIPASVAVCGLIQQPCSSIARCSC